MRTIKNKDKEIVKILEKQFTILPDEHKLSDFDAYNSHLKNFKEQNKLKRFSHKNYETKKLGKLIKSLEIPRGIKIEGVEHYNVKTKPEEIIEVREELKPAPRINEKKVNDRFKNLFKQIDVRNKRVKDYRYVDPQYYQYNLKGMTPEKEIDLVYGRDSEILQGHPILRAKGDNYEDFLKAYEDRKKLKINSDDNDDDDYENEESEGEAEAKEDIPVMKKEGKKLETKKASELLLQGGGGGGEVENLEEKEFEEPILDIPIFEYNNKDYLNQFSKLNIKDLKNFESNIGTVTSPLFTLFKPNEILNEKQIKDINDVFNKYKLPKLPLNKRVYFRTVDEIIDNLYIVIRNKQQEQETEELMNKDVKNNIPLPPPLPTSELWEQLKQSRSGEKPKKVEKPKEKPKSNAPIKVDMFTEMANKKLKKAEQVENKADEKPIKVPSNPMEEFKQKGIKLKSKAEQKELTPSTIKPITNPIDEMKQKGIKLKKVEQPVEHKKVKSSEASFLGQALDKMKNKMKANNIHSDNESDNEFSDTETKGTHGGPGRNQGNKEKPITIISRELEGLKKDKSKTDEYYEKLKIFVPLEIEKLFITDSDIDRYMGNVENATVQKTGLIHRDRKEELIKLLKVYNIDYPVKTGFTKKESDDFLTEINRVREILNN